MKKKHLIKFRLSEILSARGINVHQFSVMTGIHYRTALNIYHNRTAGISLDVLAKICEALEITPSELFHLKK